MHQLLVGEKGKNKDWDEKKKQGCAFGRKSIPQWNFTVGPKMRKRAKDKKEERKKHFLIFALDFSSPQISAKLSAWDSRIIPCITLRPMWTCGYGSNDQAPYFSTSCNKLQFLPKAKRSTSWHQNDIKKRGSTILCHIGDSKVVG